MTGLIERHRGAKGTIYVVFLFFLHTNVLPIVQFGMSASLLWCAKGDANEALNF